MQQSFEMGESYLSRSNHMLEQARNQFEMYRYAESVSASQECIELATKAIFLFFGEEYPKAHEFRDEELMRILVKVPVELKHRNFSRLFLINRFWSGFYLIAKYGSEKLGVGPEKLLERDEADLALKHAEECNLTATLVRGWAIRNLRAAG
jgi:HEPN domain-containing protein